MKTEYFKVGQTAYCAIYGEMEVIEIKNNEAWDIICKQKNGNYQSSYTFDGRHHRNSEIVLSQTPINPIVNKPLFQRCPAYFKTVHGNWIYSILIDIDEVGNGKSEAGFWSSTWQYETPDLIYKTEEHEDPFGVFI